MAQRSPRSCLSLRLPFIRLIQIDFLLFSPAADQSADTGNPVRRSLPRGKDDAPVGRQRDRLQSQPLDSFSADFKIRVRTAGVIDVRDRGLPPRRRVKLQNTGEAAHDLRPEIERPRFAEQAAAAGVQVMSALAEDTGHTAFFKEQIDGGVVPVAVKLPEHLQISFHGNRHARDRKACFKADTLKVFELSRVRASGADFHAFFFVAADHRIIGRFAAKAVADFPQGHGLKLPSFAVG